MSVATILVTELRILQTLDRQLLKLADKLDETFDPDDKESVKLLRLFRSMMTARRAWAKEYKLVQVPEPSQAEETREMGVEAKTGGENSQQNSESIVFSAMNDVVSPFPMQKKSRLSRKNRRRRR